jgi:hypothetical protein
VSFWAPGAADKGQYGVGREEEASRAQPLSTQRGRVSPVPLGKRIFGADLMLAWWNPLHCEKIPLPIRSWSAK